MAHDEKKYERQMIIIIGILLLVVGVFLWWHEMDVTPQLTIPTPTMPSPNAFDHYKDAAAAIVLTQASMQTMDLCIKMNTGDVMPGQMMAYPDGKMRPAPSQAAIQALLKANTAVFVKLRQGFVVEYREPPTRSFSTSLPHYAKYRKIARLLATDALARRNCGDFDGAMSSCLDGMRLGTDTPRGGPLISMLVGVALQAIVRRQVWQVVPYLDAKQARAAMSRMSDITARTYSYADTLQEEKWCAEAGLLEIFRTRNWRESLLEQNDGMPIAKFILVNKREVLRNYERYMNDLVAVAQQPYAAHIPEPHIPTDPINRMLCPVFAKARIKYEVNATQNALLLCTLALQAYHAERGAYPAALSDLAPKYLPTLPVDPFAMKGSLRYKRTGKSYVLYSIGPDGKDDGGMPSADGKRQAGKATAKAPNRIISTSDRSMGDIVAGVNVQ